MAYFTHTDVHREPLHANSIQCWLLGHCIEDMDRALLIQNAEMVFQGRVVQGDLRAESGRISEIAPGGGLTLRDGEVSIEAEGLHLLPGAIAVSNTHLTLPTTPYV